VNVYSDCNIHLYKMNLDRFKNEMLKWISFDYNYSLHL